MELTLEQALQRGIEAHKAGKAQEADRYYTAILKANPKHPDANHNMGVLAVGVGKVDEALPFFETALESRTNIAQFWLSYIDALIKLDRVADAKAVFDQAKSKGAEGEGFDQIEKRLSSIRSTTSNSQEPPKDELNALIELYNQNRLQQVFDEAQELTKRYTKNLTLWNLLGVSAAQIGQLDDAVTAFQKAIKIKPDYVEAYNNMANTLHDQGKPEEAIEVYAKAISIKPDYAEAFTNMGNVLKEQHKLNEAIEAYRKALAIKPKYAEAYNNMGIAFKVQGNLNEAIEAYTKAISMKPDFFHAYNNMGNVFKDQGRLDEAIKEYTKALAIRPDYVEALNNIGNVLQEQGKLDEAKEAYRKALSIKPDYADAHNNLGNVFKDQKKLQEAIDAYSKAISIKPELAEAWSNGAEALEKWNKLDQLEIWLDDAFNSFEKATADLHFMKSKLLWRKKRYEETFFLIKDIDFKSISDIRKQDYLQLKAKCFEKFKKFEQAYKCFAESNALAKQSDKYKVSDPENYFQNLKNKLSKLRSRSQQNLKTNFTGSSDFTPTFLVGFPRSGTTLLDTILRSHSKINVVEEQGMLSTVEGFLRQNGHTNFAEELIPSKLNLKLQTIYRREFKKHIESTALDKINIDKLPLNLLQAPLIHQLYSDAKFILALRHPFDTILSCWMQNFKLNPAMANMVDLHRIVDFYCIAMEIFKICRTSYNLNVHEIRYEDLVNNFHTESKAILQFLNLQWEPEMENYIDTALKRGLIHTPSYSQVVQPIYKDAQYRWLNYQKYLEQYFSQVKPWISEFGYN